MGEMVTATGSPTIPGNGRGLPLRLAKPATRANPAPPTHNAAALAAGTDGTAWGHHIVRFPGFDPSKVSDPTKETRAEARYEVGINVPPLAYPGADYAVLAEARYCARARPRLVWRY
jgi:hypothetical protein